jgi:glycosyltransferase involved in cell wall biosynthesis
VRVTFVLPDVKFTTPSGGYRVHYEMAGQLAARGHSVTVLHVTQSRRIWVRSAWRRLARRPMRDLIQWFELSDRVQLEVVRRVTRRSARKTDAYLFTGWSTLRDWPRVRGSAPANVLVWDYEFWAEGGDELRASMRAAFAQPDLALVAGSAAVAAMLEAMALPITATIPPGLDHEVFHPGAGPGTRAGVGLLYRPGARRGIDDALAALERVHARDGSTRLSMGGRPERALPQWLDHRATDSDAELGDFYRSLAVFVLPSRVEGLGLPALEAMACGTTVVVTDNGGSRDYARDGDNCLVVPTGDPEAMAGAVERLLDDDDLRARLAAAGVATAAGYTWERATDALERVLRNTAG